MHLRWSPLVYRWMTSCWAVPVPLAQLIFTWPDRRQMRSILLYMFIQTKYPILVDDDDDDDDDDYDDDYHCDYSGGDGGGGNGGVYHIQSVNYDMLI